MSDGELLDTRVAYEGSIVRVTVDTVRQPGGNVVELETIRRPGVAAVVPIDDAGRVLLIRQYRFPSGGFLLEVPAGKIDSGEDPQTCALRETEEETGHRPERLIPMGWIWTTPSFTDQKIWLFAATGLQPATQNLQEDEVLTVERTPLDEAVEMAGRGDIVDAKSICALLRAPRYLSA